MATETVQHYVSRFAEMVTARGPTSVPWLRQVREVAIDRFAELGFPSTRDEKWRFTNFSRLADKAFAIRNGNEKGLPLIGKEAPRVGWWSDVRIVFVDGRYSPNLSSPGGLADGAYFGCLSSALTDKPGLLQRNLTSVADVADSPFTALNTAFFSDGVALIVPDGVHVEKPVQLLFLTSQAMNDRLTHPRNFVLLGESAEATVIESYVGLGASSSWTNPVTEIVLGDGANLKLHRFQDEDTAAFHTATTQCRQGRESNLGFTTVDFGSSLTRHDTNFQLCGPGAACSLHGLTHLRGKQHADNHTTIDHATPHGTSDEKFTGIFDDNSHGVFTGRVLVRPDAQRTDAMQSSRSLLLSDSARADTQPQLEIFADDVKCTHGSTVGPIDADALFYLRSKGLTSDDARAMLTYGFAVEMINAISTPGLRDFLASLLKSRLDSDARKALGNDG